MTGLRPLVIWYKREGDAPVPSSYKAKAASKVHQNLPMWGPDSTNALAAEQLPDPQHAAEDAGDAVANGIAMI